MEDVLKRLLKAEMEAEARVEDADARRKATIQGALDAARQREAEFARQVEARRKPFLAAAEEGAMRRVTELEVAAAETQRRLREQAGKNEEAAVEAAIALIVGENRQG
jgi:vacuolar-type H+-ATPase subunit H